MTCPCTCLHYRGLCCTWRCQQNRGLCCTWTWVSYWVPLGDIQNSVHERITEFRKMLANYATGYLTKFREIKQFCSEYNILNSLSMEFRRQPTPNPSPSPFSLLPPPSPASIGRLSTCMSEKRKTKREEGRWTMFVSSGGGGLIHFLHISCNPTGPMYFCFCRLYPHSPPATTAVFGFNLYSLLTLYCRCGLLIHMIGEVSWDPKRRPSVGHLVFNPLCCNPSNTGSDGNQELIFTWTYMYSPVSNLSY